MNNITEIATSMIAFTGFLVELVAVIYYSYQIKKINPFEAVGIAVMYININILFLLYLNRGIK